MKSLPKAFHKLPLHLLFFVAVHSATVVKAAHSGCERWSGKYQQTSGPHQMEISCEVDDLISFKITRSAEHDSIAEFLAIVEGSTARMAQPNPTPHCKLTLKRSARGVSVVDHCVGEDRLEGLYTRVQNN